MARLSKRDMLAQIREKLHSMAFESSGNQELDIVSAGNAVLRENGYDPNVDYLPPGEERIMGKQGENPPAIVPSWANGTANRPGEITELVETLTSRRPQIITGNRVSRNTWLFSKVVKVAGKEPVPDQAKVKFERRTYTVSTHATHPYIRRKEPKWARSELDLKLFLRNANVYREDNPLPVWNPVGNWYNYHSSEHFGVYDPNERTVRQIARARSDVQKNQAEQDAIDRMLWENQRAIESETGKPFTLQAFKHGEKTIWARTQAVPVSPFVKPGNIGLASPAMRPHGKWFQRVAIPVSA